MRDALRSARVIIGAAIAADRRGVALGALLGIAAWIAVPLQAVVIKVFIDAGSRGESGSIVLATVALGVVLGGMWYVNSLRQLLRLTVAERTHHELDKRLQRLVGDIEGIEHLERPDYLDRVSTLQTQSRHFGNVDDLIDLPGLILNVIFTGALLISLDPVLVIIPFATIPTLWLTGRSETVIRHAEEASAPQRRMRRSMLDLATGTAAASEARLFEAGTEIARRHRAADAEFGRGFDRAQVHQVLLMTAGWTVYAAAFGFAFLIVVPAVHLGRLGIGDLFLMFYLVRGIAWQSDWAIWSIVDVRRALSATRNYLWLVDHAAAARRTARRASLPGAGVLRFDHVSFHYPGTERDVLTDVSFEVPAGRTLALVGDNGAGKTTLVKLLARFYEPTAGRITVDGVDLGDLDIGTWRATLSACLQDFSRFEFVTRETVGVGSLAAVEDRARVTAAVVAAGADDVVAGLDAGLETQLGTAWEGGAELSTGQWQKLALGRGMMRDAPRLLLLDEPTAALDAGAEARLFERYAAASEYAGRTGSITIIVSHRMSTVRMADVIAVIEGGRLREFGTHAELVKGDGPYRELYQTQAAAYAN